MQLKKTAKDSLGGLGGRVRRARNRLNLTQEALANQANLSMSTLSKIETGTSTPTLDALIRIAHVLGESPDQLLEWTPADLSGEARKRAALMADVEAVLAPTPLIQLEALVAFLQRK